MSPLVIQIRGLFKSIAIGALAGLLTAAILGALLGHIQGVREYHRRLTISHNIGGRQPIKVDDAIIAKQRLEGLWLFAPYGAGLGIIGGILWHVTAISKRPQKPPSHL
jgi:hypothetical protein